MDTPLEFEDRREDQKADPAVVRVVGAAIVQEGPTQEGREKLACLLAQRGDSMAEPGKWEFPGGKIETGEGPREALAREIREELALEIAVGEWLGRGTSENGGRRIVLDVYLARIVDGEVRLAEHRDWGWFEAEGITGLDWAAADVPILGALQEILAGGFERREAPVS